MQVLDTQVERLSGGRIRVTTMLGPVRAVPEAGVDELGEGPTGDAIPDRIVRFLVATDTHSADLAEIQAGVGGNPATVNRQAWTLATNAPDLQRRLRGWVRTVGRGRYALTDAASRRVSRRDSPFA